MSLVSSIHVLDHTREEREDMFMDRRAVKYGGYNFRLSEVFQVGGWLVSIIVFVVTITWSVGQVQHELDMRDRQRAEEIRALGDKFTALTNKLVEQSAETKNLAKTVQRLLIDQAAATKRRRYYDDDQGGR